MRLRYIWWVVVTIVISFSVGQGCTHKKVAVHKTTDTRLTCEQIASEIAQVDSVKADITDKTGFSARNVGMELLFWPGVIVNEMQGSSAEEVANKRLDKLHGLYTDNGCDDRTKAVEEME